ncbi:unnamed protein product, partial [Heterosigma akashiwo]
STSGAKQFACFPDFQSVYEFVIYHPKESRCFYELITENDQVKPYFDIDLNNTVLEDEDKENLIEGILIELRNALQNNFNIELNLTSDNIIVLDSSSNTKTSMHLIIADIHFESNQHQKQFILTYLKNILSKSNIYGIDTSVYTKNRSFRLPHCTKMGKNTYLEFQKNGEIATKDDFYKALITNVDEETSILVPMELTEYSETFTHLNISNEDISTLEKAIIDNIENLVHASDNYEDWINLGRSMKNANCSLHTFHQFSKLSNKYSIDETTRKWESFEVSEQNNIEYLINNLKNYNKIYFSPLPREMTLYFKKMFGTNHVYVPETESFYSFHSIYKRWIDDKQNTLINRTISTDFYNHFESLCQIAKDDLKNLQNEYTDILEKIQSKPPRKCIDSMSNMFRTYLREDGFYHKLDSNPYLLGFDNGVIDLKTGQLMPNKSDYYITMSCGYDYRKPTDEETEQLECIIKQIFPIESDYNYTQVALGAALSGEMNSEKLHFWTGLSNKQTGANGKSTLANFLLETLGDYAVQCHPNIVSNAREESSSASPYFMDLKNKRIGIIEELADTTLTGSVIKQLTGGTKIRARALYGKPEDIKPTFNMFICCNDIPACDKIDGGLKRRLVSQPFVSKFVENTDDFSDMEYIFEVDYDLKNRLPGLKHAMMNWLLEGYMKFQANGFPENDRYKASTQQYFTDTDIVQEFISDNIIQDEGAYMLYKDVKNRRCSKMREMFKTDKAFKSALEDRLNGVFLAQKKMNNKNLSNVLMGYRLVSEYDDDF